jgi:hAT family C-terminal dimerisation region
MNDLISYYLGSIGRDNIDILSYWKRKEITYPTLAMMTRDVFASPVSTIPYEFYFSSTNMILTYKRSRLGAKTFE